MQELPPLDDDDVPLLPAELLPAVNLRGVLPELEVPVLFRRSELGSAPLLPLLLVMLLLLLLGDELPDADITNLAAALSSPRRILCQSPP